MADVEKDVEKKEPLVNESNTEVANLESVMQAVAVEAQKPESVPADAAPQVSPLAETIAALQAEHKKTYDRLLRTAADLENYKRRSRQESIDKVKRAEEKIVLDFLPVMDNLERAIAASESVENSPLREGVKMVYRQFLAVLDQHGIAQQEVLGQPFDPTMHEALQQTPSDKPAGTVCQVLQKGYRRGDKVVRPAMVIVSSGPAPAATANEPGAVSPATPAEATPAKANSVEATPVTPAAATPAEATSAEATPAAAAVPAPAEVPGEETKNDNGSSNP